jgi:hypothetical protein
MRESAFCYAAVMLQRRRKSVAAAPDVKAIFFVTFASICPIRRAECAVGHAGTSIQHIVASVCLEDLATL